MNEIIKIQTNDKHEPIISGRELHAFLEVETPYQIWFPRMIEYGFTEGIDFCTILFKSTGGRPATNHHIKLDMAKELAMIQRTERGKQARQYFIQVEKAYNSPEQIMARALLVADNTIKQLREEKQLLTEKIEADKSKVLFADAVSASETSILIGDLAKILKQNGVEMGANRLFERLRNDGYLMKNGESRNMPTQRAMEMRLFEVKERTINNPDGSIRITKTPKVTGKGQQYFVNYFLKHETQLVLN